MCITQTYIYSHIMAVTHNIKYTITLARVFEGHTYIVIIIFIEISVYLAVPNQEQTRRGLNENTFKGFSDERDFGVGSRGGENRAEEKAAKAVVYIRARLLLCALFIALNRKHSSLGPGELSRV